MRVAHLILSKDPDEYSVTVAGYFKKIFLIVAQASLYIYFPP